MEKRITFRVTFEKMTLTEAAKIEKKIEKVLEDHGEPFIEVSSMPVLAAFLPLQPPTEG